MSEWQDISMAPKDGTEFLMWDGKTKTVGQWLVAEHIHWDGWWPLKNPIHWMPLPTPPKGSPDE